MNTLTKAKAFAQKIWFTEDKLYLLLDDGRELAVPLEWFPKLRDSNVEQRNNFRFIGKGIGIHWPDLDEDISVAGLLNA